MRGKYGVSMTIEHSKQKPKRFNHECKDCVYLKLYWGTKYPYWCQAKKAGRHYTSKVVCKKFKLKGEKNDVHLCKNCKHLAYEGGEKPFRCDVSQDEKYYTDRVLCGKYEGKNRG